MIDLDTVMPGLALYDFGDMVRTTTSKVAEDIINVTDNIVGGRLQVSTLEMDDVVRVNGNTIGKDLLLHGGAGTDLLDQGGVTPNALSAQQSLQTSLLHDFREW